MKEPEALLSVIVPVFNERETVQEILRRITAVELKKEIVVVDDGSTDGTTEILRKLEAEDAIPGARFYFQERNRGKGAAVRTGIAQARGDIILIQDADLEYNPADHPALIEPIVAGRADVVYGSRFMGGSRRVLFFWHAVGNKLLTLLSNMFTNLNLTDMETGYKAFRRDVVSRFSIEENRFGMEVEITAKVAQLKCRVYEVSIDYHGRDYSQGKKITWRDGVVAVYLILKYNLFHRIKPDAKPSM